MNSLFPTLQTWQCVNILVAENVSNIVITGFLIIAALLNTAYERIRY